MASSCCTFGAISPVSLHGAGEGVHLHRVVDEGGKKGKKFRTLGKGKVNSKGIVKVRFRLARGTYRVRFSYSGGTYVAKGTQYGTMTIRRVIL